MATRRDAREWALQILFGLDLNPRKDIDNVIENFLNEKNADERSRDFMETLVRGVTNEKQNLDTLLQRYAEHWKIKRMRVVDRNILRIALYELLNYEDTPRAVIINEAVDVAKYFSTDASGGFVNGILDKARKDIPSESK